MSTRSKWVNGILTFFEDSGYETVNPVAPIVFYDDFLNTMPTIAAAGIEGWTRKTTGTPTTAALITANQHGGIITMALANTSEKEESGIYFGDALNFNLDKGPIFECRANVSVAPTSQVELYFGLANAYVEGPIAEADAGPTVHAFFCFDGAMTPTIHTDDASTDNNAVATGVTCTTGAYNIFRIDCTDVTNVKFYIDGVGVGTGTTFSMANSSNVMVQPFLIAHKENAGAGVGTLNVDYVRVWSGR
jgi:hypothetical protein